MDLLAHAFYGATIFSRPGCAGGRRFRAATLSYPWIFHPTIWAAAFFGMLPDIVSMGLPFLEYWRADVRGNFFVEFGGVDLEIYRYMHSLLVSVAAVLTLRILWPPVFVPAWAWPLHVIMDSVTHGTGKFQTLIFYPVSSWGINGIRWWEHPGLVEAYWSLLPLMWLGLWFWRRNARLTPSLFGGNRGT